jgi:hypothetical protein
MSSLGIRAGTFIFLPLILAKDWGTAFLRNINPGGCCFMHNLTQLYANIYAVKQILDDFRV